MPAILDPLGDTSSPLNMLRLAVTSFAVTNTERMRHVGTVRHQTPMVPTQTHHAKFREIKSVQHRLGIMAFNTKTYSFYTHDSWGQVPIQSKSVDPTLSVW